MAALKAKEAQQAEPAPAAVDQGKLASLEGHAVLQDAQPQLSEEEKAAAEVRKREQNEKLKSLMGTGKDK